MRMGDLTGCFFPVIKNGAVLFGAEAEKSFLGIVLSRAQDRGWELRLIRCFWKVLGFQAETGTFLVNLICFAGQGIGKHIATVELDPGLCSQHLHHPP